MNIMKEWQTCCLGNAFKDLDCSLILITPTKVQLSQTLGTENEYSVFLSNP